MADKSIVQDASVGKETRIYGLFDTRTEQIRYVGKTTKSLKSRLRTHIGMAQDGKKDWYVSRWIRSLGAPPDIRLLETVPPLGDWIEAEQFWIANCRFLGCRLTNHTQGGDGTHGYRFTDEQRETLRRTHAGQTRSDETIKKYVAAMAARRAAGITRPPPSKETIEKNIATRAANKAAGKHKGTRKPASPETRAKISAAKKLQNPHGPKVSEEAIRRRGEKRRGMKASEKARENMRRSRLAYLYRQQVVKLAAE